MLVFTLWSLDVRSDLLLGLGGWALADCVMDSVRTLLVGTATPKAGLHQLAHILLLC